MKEPLLSLHTRVIRSVTRHHHNRRVIHNAVAGPRVVLKENKLVGAEVEQQSVQSAQQSVIQQVDVAQEERHSTENALEQRTGTIDQSRWIRILFISLFL